MRFADTLVPESISKNKAVFLGSIIALCVFFFSGKFIPSFEFVFLGMIGLSLILFSVFKFELALYQFIATLMLIETFFFTLSVAFFFSFIVLFFYAVKKPDLSAFKNWLAFPLVVFIISTLPSYINSVQYTRSIAESFQWGALFCIASIFGVTLKDDAAIKRMIWFFVFVVFLSSLTTISSAAFSMRRQFGFSGIAFIDLCGVAIMFMIASLFYEKKFRAFKTIVLLILLLAEFLTQTRNVFITLAISIFFVIILLFKEKDSLAIKKRNIIAFIAVFFMVLAIVLVIIYSYNPEMLARLSSKPNKILDEEVMSIGSFTSRLLIWDTAFNGFKAHPYVGIGFYTFPIASKIYSTINPMLYSLFVARLTPHETIIALFCEVGIVGFLGFSFLYISLVRAMARVRKTANSKKDITRTAMINSALIYILISLFATDAWLFGNLIMLWAFILGLFTANLNILKNADSMVPKG